MIELGQTRFADSGIQMHYLHGHANIGYGTAHNLALHGTGADYQLVLNPDVELAPDALANAVRWLDAHPDVGALAPAVTNAHGEPEYLCKRYPAVFDLLLRGFAPGFVRRLFRRRLDRYELRDRIDPDGDEPVLDVPIMSGACMLVKRMPIDVTGGFDPKFFLYFEDFDWSVRLAQGDADRVAARRFASSTTAAAPRARASSTSAWFVRSGLRFYRKHGWRWF